MAISSAQLLVGAATAPVGGNATNLLSKGDSFLQHNTVLDDASPFGLQTTVNFSVKEPKISSAAPAGYTQGRNVILLTIPKTLANGLVTKNTVRIEFSADSETTSAERDVMREYAAQLAIDPNLDNFYHTQAVS